MTRAVETTDDGLMTMTLRIHQKVASHEFKNSRIGLAFQSSNSKFLWLYFAIFSDGPIIPWTLSPPAQWYITQRPPAVARISANRPAEITAEIWSPGNTVAYFIEHVYIAFIKSTEANFLFGPGRTNAIYALNALHWVNVIDVEGVKATVVKFNTSSFNLTKYSINVQSEMPGLLTIVFEASMGPMGGMALFSEVSLLPMSMGLFSEVSLRVDYFSVIVNHFEVLVLVVRSTHSLCFALYIRFKMKIY